MTKRYSIVGIEHRKQEAFVTALAPGADVILVREPHNPHDPLAIAVWANDGNGDYRHVGYIPKKQNQQLAGRIDMTGEKWDGPIDATGSAGTAQDAAMPRSVGARSIPAKFVRSPNSGFPMVEVAG